MRTQLPYALTVGFTAIVIGTIPAAYGISAFILFPLAIALFISANSGCSERKLPAPIAD